jgi:hypothetical protein
MSNEFRQVDLMIGDVDRQYLRVAQAANDAALNLQVVPWLGRTFCASFS